MSTHNICFRGEIRKILCGYPLLSVAMSVSMKKMSFVKPITSSNYQNIPCGSTSLVTSFIFLLQIISRSL